ncbi:MAG: GTP 3',8-cyclase MoaA [Nitrososphaerales archaeon]
MGEKQANPLCDSWGRPVTDLRISLNSSGHCNFGCIFCHREGITDPYLQPMTPDEIRRIVELCVDSGVTTVKLTGGEPMLRPDIVEIVEQINSTGVKEISMTTNGTRLAKLASSLRTNGLQRVNVSLHSLKMETFKFLTQSTRLDETLEAIRSAIASGLTPVKLNMTLLKGINENEVDDMIAFSGDMGGGRTNVLQLIEMVIIDSPVYQTYHMELNQIEARLAKQSRSMTERVLHRRPRYELQNGVTVEIVRPMDNPTFCMGNNRIRVTYDGKFKPCLLRGDNHLDFLSLMRNGGTDIELKEVFKKAVSLRKPFFKPGRSRHQFAPLPMIPGRSGD